MASTGPYQRRSRFGPSPISTTPAATEHRFSILSLPPSLSGSDRATAHAVVGDQTARAILTSKSGRFGRLRSSKLRPTSINSLRPRASFNQVRIPEPTGLLRRTRCSDALIAGNPRSFMRTMLTVKGLEFRPRALAEIAPTILSP